MCDGNNSQGVAFNTPLNTMGIGDPMPAGNNNNNLGSGDIFTTNKTKPYNKKQSPTCETNSMFPPLIVYKK